MKNEGKPGSETGKSTRRQDLKDVRVSSPRISYHRFIICLKDFPGSGRVVEHLNPRFSPSFLELSTTFCSGRSI